MTKRPWLGPPEAISASAAASTSAISASDLPSAWRRTGNTNGDTMGTQWEYNAENMNGEREREIYIYIFIYLFIYLFFIFISVFLYLLFIYLSGLQTNKQRMGKMWMGIQWGNQTLVTLRFQWPGKYRNIYRKSGLWIRNIEETSCRSHQFWGGGMAPWIESALTIVKNHL